MNNKLKINRVLFVLDRSGSMQGIMPNAIAALNANIATLRDEMQSKGQSGTVSLITFNDTVTTHFFDRPINEVKELTRHDVSTGGMTALFDATGDGIQQLLDRPVGQDEDVSYLVIAITDGAENASQKFDSSMLCDLMNKVQGTDLWTLTFLVPRGYGRSMMQQFGIPEGNIMEWDASVAGVKRYQAQVQQGLSNYINARASGEKHVRSFFVNLSQVNVNDVKQLDDLSQNVTVLTVDRDDDIKSFLERKIGYFKKGAAFYQLIGGKDHADKVQDYKKILIMEKGKSQVFGGDDARQVLGLPDATTKVRPGDLNKFDLFIQSTSTNRKVKAGTKIIHMPSAAI